MSGLVLYESLAWRELRPLTDTLPVPGLAFGASDLATRWIHATGLPLRAVLARPEALAAWQGAPRIVPARDQAEDLLVVDAAALPGPWVNEALAVAPPAVFTAGGALIGARVEAATVEPALRGRQPIEDTIAALVAPREVAARRLARPWDLIAANAGAIAADLLDQAPARDGDVHALAALLAPERIAVRRGARVDPFAVLDARGGPILIDEGAIVLPHTVVVGPCVVGRGTQLLGGVIARSTLGPECRIAGEVEECVWQGYGNKRHHGFAGHSLFGEWVNLGALTTTSDLKNNYGNVRVWVDGREVDSGSPKVGAIVGAHVKTGIGTLLPTGASVGVGANLFAGGVFVPREVPAFAWWDGRSVAEHRLEPFLATARIAMSRRGRELSAHDERLLREIFGATASDRTRAARG